jgi:RNA polymerase sigma factor (sigma-70 family)
MTTELQFTEDKELVSLYQSGNEKALEMLLSRYQSRIFSFIIVTVRDRQLAEDIFQDTFVKIIHTLKKGQYYEDGKFVPWVLRIAKNLIIDHYRNQKKMPPVKPKSDEKGEPMDIFSTIRHPDSNAEERILKGQKQKTLRRLIEELPFEQREILMMRHYYDMSFKEIADLKKISINTAIGRMRYALIRLRKLMKEKDMLAEF